MAYNLRNIRVLVVDGNMPMRTLIRALLLDLGFGTVDIAGTGKIGFDLYHKNQPDIIMVDWRAESTEGLDFTKQVRRDAISKKSKVPIIMMTGFVSKERVLAARDAGITEFLLKPFTVQSLTSHLMGLIEKPRDFVVTKKFKGPDRRRINKEVEDKKRITEAKKNAKYIDLRGSKIPPEKGKD